ncbi:MAG: FAD-dependent oxidoreductase [Gammaproteobacteria bacterium]|nr:FAD-dependent oxidoreductase [Gammaproteobacteria bacterium]
MSLAIPQASHTDDVVVSRTTVPYDSKAVVVVGSGPVGMQFVSELCKRIDVLPVVIYGSEPWKPYDRVKLSSYLSGSVDREELELTMPLETGAELEFRLNCPVQRIDRKRQTVIDALGNEQHYSHLVLAVGSSPFIPSIGNVHYEGVFTFRSLSEADVLSARKLKSQHTVVIGGGLLGLETARAMQRHNTQITIVEHNQWLMMQQLDEPGGEYLKEFVEENGVCVELGDSVVSILGNGRVEGVSLLSGREIACDTVIIAAGIRPNIKLARDSRLSYNRGIRINDYLETSDKNIYAIGECAEHNGNVYGIVNPGLEQAAVLADRVAGGGAKYIGSLESTRLKVMKQSVFSAGRTGVDEESAGSVREYVYKSRQDGIYRKIRLSGNRLIGAISVGDWHESSLLQDAIKNRKRLAFWNLIRFRSRGVIWGSEEDMDVRSWPSAAVVCNCTGVTRGRLTQAVNAGCTSINCLSSETRAASVCGSCKPLLAELVGAEHLIEPGRLWRSLVVMSVSVLLVSALFLLIKGIPYPETVQVSIRWDELWRDPLLKQISGFTMLGLMLVGLGISLRKRVNRIAMGDFSLWRYIHVFLGLSTLAVLIMHTGFRVGDQLNQLLMTNFLLLAIVGAVGSTVIAAEHRLPPMLAKKQRHAWTWLHIVLFWPFPILLGFHIVKGYYF